MTFAVGIEIRVAGRMIRYWRAPAASTDAPESLLRVAK
jgi:hypothetical protein